jgi:hypothetical protein
MIPLKNHMDLAPFIKLAEGIHPVVDYTQLQSCYPEIEDEVSNISSASDLLGWEKLREQYEIRDSQEVPCDIFVWGVGPSPDPRLTRIGGVPWLPKHQPWPDIDGVIPVFLCQFNFQDSKDLIGQRVAEKLPGDILLVFVADENSAMSNELKEMRFVWVSAEDKEVIDQSDVPAPTNPFEFVKAWGVRYRGRDIPTKWDQAYEIPDGAGEGMVWALPVLRATKIGGVPYNSQDNHRVVPPQFLCQLVSVQASMNTIWPWIDRKDPIKDFSGEDGIYNPGNTLLIGDLGELSIFLDDENKVFITSACG